jgi:prepilin-type N-terminal cleavage/methylation domain-containing protein
MKRAAFTLIELIVTIVIVGIVSLSFPLIMSQTSKNLEVAMQQEAILAAKTYIGTIVSYPWDGNAPVFGVRTMILDTNGTAADNEFDRIAGTNLRLGNIDGEGRRRLVDASAATTHPTETGSFGVIAPAFPADIDGFNNYAQNLSVSLVDMDYIFSLRLTPIIAYISDDAIGGAYSGTTINFNFNTAGIAGTTNIKMIAVNVVGTAGAPNVNITLRAYSANIGEFDLLSKDLGDW